MLQIDNRGFPVANGMARCTVQLQGWALVQVLYDDEAGKRPELDWKAGGSCTVGLKYFLYLPTRRQEVRKGIANCVSIIHLESHKFCHTDE